jgi:hypothetical protein
MLRRLVDASYDGSRATSAAEEQAAFWLAELRSPEFLRDAVERVSSLASVSMRMSVLASLHDGDVAAALAEEQAQEMAADRVWSAPLRRELEALRRAARRTE